MPDVVNHPEHYNLGKFEAFDVILASLGYDETLDYCKGAALKYWLRHKRKGHAVEDIRKAKWYTDKYLDMIDHPEKYNGTGTDDILDDWIDLDAVLEKAKEYDPRVKGYIDDIYIVEFIDKDGTNLFGFRKSDYSNRRMYDYFDRKLAEEDKDILTYCEE